MNTLPIRAQVAQILLQHFPTSEFSAIGHATDQICMLTHMQPHAKPSLENFTEFLLTLTLDHPVRGIIPFEPMAGQAELACVLESNEPRIIHRGARQTGKTHMMIALSAWTALTKPNQFILYVTTNQSTLSNSRQILERILVPEYSKHIDSHSVRHVRFSNGNQIHFVNAKSAYEAKGRACSMIIIDDADTISKKYEDDLLNWVYPMISQSGRIIITGSYSTFSGLFNATLNNSSWHKIDQI